MIHTKEETVCGLLGKTLGHSFSPRIHAAFADYDYRLFEVAEDELGGFLRSGGFHALNVTIPYKQAVIPYLSGLSDRARRIGAVNTILRKSDGSLFGDNTDYDGFLYLVRRSGIRVADKKILVLGSGGASKTVVTVLHDLCAREIIVISRGGEDNYGNLGRHADADVIVNTTPVGMYPHNGEAPLPLDGFPRLSGVLDVIYNPAKTALLLEAERRGIPFMNGLPMLVAQAKRAAELFTEESVPDGETDLVTREIAGETANLVLVGMPGSGKSTVGKRCADALGKRFLDTDDMIRERTGRTPGEIITSDGEEVFRRIEADCVREAGKQTGVVIATGGGVVTREENYAPLCQNGRIIYLMRDPSALPRKNRPLSAGDLGELLRVRDPLYRRFADGTAQSQPDVRDTVKKVLEAYANATD